ncbi:solute carrier family 26 member 6 [Pelobates cultripes]|uniref:Solute carrier family 26 member 6 n=1 Tax=Pelobates cultripes TaxID=61616 RepID=A0AAD1SYF7_PELCU|nr:solute carrier family 26 member 6 [Pelobates cultripes]
MENHIDENEKTSSVFSEAELEYIAPRSHKTGPSLLSRLGNRLRCSGQMAKSLLFKFIPILYWLPRYPFKEWLLGDIISGLSVGIIQLPQGLAYALLAGVPPVFGLYSSFYPVFIYSIFGTSRHISAGTFAVISVMVGSVTESLVPNDTLVVTTNESLSDTGGERVAVAASLTFLVGIFQILLGLVQFGFVVTYLSEPLIRGYTTAAAIHVTVSQIKSIFGVSITQRSHALSLIYTIVEICSKLPQTNIASLITGLIAIGVLFIVKYLNEKYYSKIRIPIPMELITLIVATGISYGVNLNETYGVDIVGTIPVGMKAPVLPRSDLFPKVVGNAFAIAVVVYAFTISLAKMFAAKHGYTVDNNQELIALGLSNFVGGFFSCFTIGTAMSRSLVQESTGGNSQVAGVVSCLVILVIILKAGELFETLPKAILAAVVVVNLKGIFKQFLDIPMLWRTNRIDLLVWLVTFAATILLNLDIGLGVSVAFSIITIIFRTQLPHYSVLGQVSNTDIYRDVARYAQAKEIPGIKIFQSSCTLYFANADLYANAVKSMSGLEVDKLIAMKKKAMKKQKQMEEKNEKLKKKENDQGEGAQGGGGGPHPSFRVDMPLLALHITRNGLPSAARTNYEVIEEAKQGFLGNGNIFHSLILDLSTVNFLDTVSVKILKNIFRDFTEIDVTVYIAGCHAMVLEQLEKANFFSKTITKGQFFSSIKDAVTHILNTQSLTPEQRNEIFASTKL